MIALDRVALWDAINAYVEACGGDPSRHVYGNTTRQRAVADVERIVRGPVPVVAEKTRQTLLGLDALRVHRLPGGAPRLMDRVKVKRETKCQWIDDAGYRYWKAGRACAGYKNEFLMTENEFLAAGGVL